MGDAASNNSAIEPGDFATEPTTRERLIVAAAAEFNARGYLGTDTNRIARAAGFAPQTFYRNFKDKLEVFLAAYDRWVSEEYRAIDAVAMREDFDLAIADIILAHHRDWAVFRKSLKLLRGTDARVDGALLRSFKWKLGRVRKLPANAARTDGELTLGLLAIERLADAITDGELAGLGIGGEEARGLMAKAITEVCGEG